MCGTCSCCSTVNREEIAMATKRTSKPRRAAKKPKARGNAKNRTDIVLGPIITKEVRVPINLKEYKAKESQVAQLDVKIRKIQKRLAPDLKDIRDARKLISKLSEDLEENTELRPMKVKLEMHFKTSEVRVLRADDLKELERRTMTKEELTRNDDLEDQKLTKPTDRGAVENDGEQGDGTEDEGEDPEPAPAGEPTSL